jgi:hypothetical protein
MSSNRVPEQNWMATVSEKSTTQSTAQPARKKTAHEHFYQISTMAIKRVYRATNGMSLMRELLGPVVRPNEFKFSSMKNKFRD